MIELLKLQQTNCLILLPDKPNSPAQKYVATDNGLRTTDNGRRKKRRGYQFSLTYADSDTNSVTNSDTNSGTLSEKQKVVLDFCRKPRNAREIMDRIGISYHSKNMKIYVKDLVLGGCLRLTIPDKPNSPAQKYVTTDDGLRTTDNGRR